MSDARKSGKRIIDIAHPGQSAPSKTSKPVIITNRTILKDPMMVEQADEPAADGAKAAKTTAPTLAPATAKAALADNVKPAETPAAEPEPEVPKPAPAAESEPAPPAQAEPESEQETEKEAEEPTATSESPDKLTADAADTAKAAAEHDAAIQKLVDSKQYYLPINSVEKRKTRRFVVLGLLLVILLGLVWVDVALDAGLLHINNVQPLTHFFSN